MSLVRLLGRKRGYDHLLLENQGRSLRQQDCATLGLARGERGAWARINKLSTEMLRLFSPNGCCCCVTDENARLKLSEQNSRGRIDTDSAESFMTVESWLIALTPLGAEPHLLKRRRVQCRSSRRGVLITRAVRVSKTEPQCLHTTPTNTLAVSAVRSCPNENGNLVWSYEID
jgi:hypothetical protein